MITLARAYELRAKIEQASALLDDSDALDAIELFPAWTAGVTYAVDVRVRYNDKLYRVVQAHTSQSDWTPDVVPALFTEVALPGEIPVWVQPTGAQDAYQTGDQVYYPDANGNIYESLIDNNIWSPEAYPAGWQLVS